MTDKQTDPAVLAQARTLNDQVRVIQKARKRGEETKYLVVGILLGVAKAVAAEFANKRLLFRLLPEDMVYDAELLTYAVAADIERWSLAKPPPRLTLVDTGIYPPELTGQVNCPLSAKSTVYNTAALLYYTATGLKPIAGFSLIADKLPPVRIFEPNLSAGIDPILRRALARNPDQRFDDPQTFFQELQKVVELDVMRRAAHVDAPLRIHYAAATHPGINKGHKNPQNQDRFFDAFNPTRRLGLFVVADGVSTCHFGSGDRAATKVVEAADATWEAFLADSASNGVPSSREDQKLITLLAQMFEDANQAVIRQVAQDFPQKIKTGDAIMSSTGVAVFLNGRRLIIGNLGDSRIYLIRTGVIDQVTVDMDRRTSLLRRGKGLEAITNASGLGQLTGNIGVFVVPDKGGGIEAAPLKSEFISLNLLAGDRILICSDGVPDCIGANAPEKIKKIVLASEKPVQNVWDLIVAANQNGGDDNITAIVLACFGKEESK